MGLNGSNSKQKSASFIILEGSQDYKRNTIKSLFWFEWLELPPSRFTEL